MRMRTGRLTRDVEEAEVQPHQHHSGHAGLGVLLSGIGEDASSHAESDEAKQEGRPDPQEDLLATNILAGPDSGDLTEPSEDVEARVDAGLGGRVRDTDEIEHDGVVVVDDGRWRCQQWVCH
jgi:hypothetical protein